MEQSRRSRVDAITPERDPCSLLVLRLGYGRRALLAVSFHGVRQTTALLAPVDAAEFLDAAPLTADQRRELAGKLLDHR